jgi:AcrR family transcriptional regulator
MSDARTYNSELRQSQAEATRTKILDAMAAIYEEEGRIEAATVRAVAARAGVREITVYRHFPNREILLQALWTWLNRKHGVTVGMPESADEIVAKMAPLYQTFEAAPGHVLASIRTPEGLKIRESLNAERSASFMAVLREVAPDLDPADQAKAAAVLQLLYSANAWVSMREQWGLSGDVAAEAAAWAAETLLADLRARGKAPIQPAQTGAVVKDATQ